MGAIAGEFQADGSGNDFIRYRSAQGTLLFSINSNGQISLQGSGVETLGQKLRRLEAAARQANAIVNPPLTAPAAWASSTGYTAGQVVSNGGNDYVCYTAGTSAGSGGPSGTGANGITDNTVVWYFYRVTVTASSESIAPSISLTSSAPMGLSNAYAAGTNDNCFFYSGGVPIASYAGYRFNTVTNIGTGNVGTNQNNFAWRVTFNTDAPKFAIQIGQSNNQYRVIVDGQYITLSSVTASNGGGSNYYVVDYTSAGGRKNRTVTIESLGPSNFIGVNVDYASVVWAPDTSDRVRVMFVGDSYTAGGNNFPIFPCMDWPSQVGKLLSPVGWDVWNEGSGGTGFIANDLGQGYNFLGRINDTINNAPNLVVVMGGANDVNSSTVAQVGAAALTYFRALRKALPNVPIIVTGIYISNPASSSVLLDEAAIAQAVMATEDPLTYFFPIETDPQGEWSTGAGNVTSTTGSGNGDVYISGDAVHPVQQGIDYLANRCANQIRSIIAQIP